MPESAKRRGRAAVGRTISNQPVAAGQQHLGKWKEADSSSTGWRIAPCIFEKVLRLGDNQQTLVSSAGVVSRLDGRMVGMRGWPRAS